MRLLLPALFLALPASAQDRPVLTVMTYDSFVSEWGPGPVIKSAFEAECGCELRFQAAGDGAALMARLRLEGARARADVVLGLDTSLIEEATRTGLFAPHGIAMPALDLPVEWSDPVFVPYDWGHFAFVYDTDLLPRPPTSFEDLAASSVSILIQDPRSSTPGLGLLMWVKAVYGDRAPEIWAGLSDNIVTVTPGWTEAYNLFLRGEADMVLSYTTSPAYHIAEEGDFTKRAAMFDEGHYLQIEVAARVASSPNPELASRFLAFLLSEPAQTALAGRNWMFPVVTPEQGLPKGFETLDVPRKALLLAPEAAAGKRTEALAEWLHALSR